MALLFEPARRRRITLEGSIGVDRVASYIASFITLDNSLLESVSEQERNTANARPNIGAEVGKFVGLLVRLIQAKQVLELGTGLGYSTIWLGEALRTTGGKLISVENDANIHSRAQKNVAAAGLSSIVELVLGDAPGVVETLKGPFDLILQDSGKSLYPLLLERCIQLTRDYGIIVADDALFRPLGVSEGLSDPIHNYNQMVFSDQRLYSTILPVGDGLTISIKLEGQASKNVR
jgi:predicted O-methyltransferase YrrM